MAGPIVARGTLLKSGANTIAYIQSFNGPTPDVIFADKSSIADQWKSYLGTQIEPGELSFRLFYDPSDTQAKALLTQLTGAFSTYSITYSDGTSICSFSAATKSFVASGEKEGLIEANVVLKVSGAITFPT